MNFTHEAALAAVEKAAKKYKCRNCSSVATIVAATYDDTAGIIRRAPDLESAKEKITAKIEARQGLINTATAALETQTYKTALAIIAEAESRCGNE